MRLVLIFKDEICCSVSIKLWVFQNSFLDPRSRRNIFLSMVGILWCTVTACCNVVIAILAMKTHAGWGIAEFFAPKSWKILPWGRISRQKCACVFPLDRSGRSCAPTWHGLNFSWIVMPYFQVSHFQKLQLLFRTETCIHDIHPYLWFKSVQILTDSASTTKLDRSRHVNIKSIPGISLSTGQHTIMYFCI